MSRSTKQPFLVCCQPKASQKGWKQSYNRVFRRKTRSVCKSPVPPLYADFNFDRELSKSFDAEWELFQDPPLFPWQITIGNRYNSPHDGQHYYATPKRCKKLEQADDSIQRWSRK